MSERILKALMQLFAIIARVDDEESGETDHNGGGRTIVELFLKQQLSQDLVEEYLKKFDEFLDQHQGKSAKKDGQRKRTSVNSVKVLKICTQINEELAQKQKVVVLVRILEFINENQTVTEQELEFASTVADTFNISRDEYNGIKSFCDAKDDDRIDSPVSLYVTSQKEEPFLTAHHIYSEGIQGHLNMFRVESVGMYLMRYFGSAEILLNGQAIQPGRSYILTNGASIRSSRVQPIYYSDIIARFLSDKNEQRIVFKCDEIMYHFKGGKVGLHPLSFSEESGKLLGIMGGSGAGKSTLLNVLNGNYPPTQGKVTINGIDIHHEAHKIEGVIGYVSQDDLLIEELTVFQNLFYNAKLCFGSLSDGEITKRVIDVLKAIGLYEAKDLRVGNPLDKTISGGQRKRLNIALELIREPSVMFVDEPTSGLSSRDSENIMDLLKELALKGKLIFVVIHQPSSDIYKMFDKLLILDVGGYPIYYGNPVDAVVYFKLCVNHVNPHESECPECGNVNPELVFNIIESKVVDEYGNLTRTRKVASKDWNDQYMQQIAPKLSHVADEKTPPESTFKIPNRIKQFRVFLIRDMLSKLTNQQYILINLLEAPLLALILAFFVKFFSSAGIGSDYVFRESENVPQFLFISVVVALFIGLTVAAEEIIKDQKILKRESFLNLSRSSYLLSKIWIMFFISAIQMMLYVAVGNYILGIKGMFLTHWIVLFSVSCFANILGLNISASFNSAKVIYILIPILIIPQLLFSGVIVKFDKLHPWFASQSSVPLVGNVMASRWAYEAMAVAQYKDNDFEKKFYPIKKVKSFANWKKDNWVKKLETKIGDVRRYLKDIPAYKEMIAQEKDGAKKAELKLKLAEMQESLPYELDIIKNEVEIEQKFIKGVQMRSVGNLTVEKVDEKTLVEAEKFLNVLKQHYRNIFNDNEKKLDKLVQSMQKTEAAKKEYDEKYLGYTNESLENFVTNFTELEATTEENGRLVQKKNLIFRDPYDKGFFGAHFYAPRKKLFGSYIDTFWANNLVIWMMTFVLAITLYFDALRRLLAAFGKISFRRKK